jgi:DUF4097 and DUF4098 domain-containing protein YvlB
MTTARLSLTMNTFKANADKSESPTARADRLAVWVLLGLGLLLMLVSTAKADQGHATRTDRFSGTLTAGQTLSVENISGDVVASPGSAFSAVVIVTVTAPNERQAEELLRNTRIEQSQDEEGFSLETRWPGMHGNRRGRGPGCPSCRVVASYELTVPPGVDVSLQTVNGGVRVKDLDGAVHLESVNGPIEASGLRRSLEAQTVNGPIDAVARAVSRESSFSLESVNGPITLTLPKNAQFDFSAETMNGTIASTFPLPPLALLPPRASHRTRGPKVKTERRIVVTDEEGVSTEVDLEELDAELSESMRELEEELREAEREIRESGREIRRVRIVDPRREYTGSIGKGGFSIQIETLNGQVLLLAAGTKESDAKSLVSERREFVVTVPVEVPKVDVQVPNVHVKPPRPPQVVPPVPPVPPAPPADFEGEVVRGDVRGDFLSTTSGGSYRLGNVSGEVRILTHSGEIRVGGIGRGGELRSHGGDIIVGPVTGDLRASTAAGDIRIDSVTGSAVADTAGGDIRIQSVGGNLDANTAGGDIIVPKVGGSVKAVTAGGDVRIAVTSTEIRGGITIRNSGGDVTLSLPPDCKADVELFVSGPEDFDSAIRSDFPELTLSRKSGSQRGTAVLNGGGEKIVVRTTSGSIRLRKNPAP